MADKRNDPARPRISATSSISGTSTSASPTSIWRRYYVTGLGLTRDPFLNTGARLMWINVGMSQFHLPNGQPDVVRGVTGLAVPDRAALLERLAQVRKPLEGTKFDFRETNDCVETICPWGNRINVHTPDENRFGRVVLGMPYIEFDVRPGTADRIAGFYRDVMGALATVVENGSGRKARVQVGEKQYWYFRETDEPEKPYDRHHAQIYIAFLGSLSPPGGMASLPWRSTSTKPLQGCHRPRHARGAVHSGARVRSQTHPLYGRP